MSSADQPEKPDKDTGPHERVGGQHIQGKPSIDITALIDAIKQERTSYQDEQGSQERWRNGREWATLAFVVATTIGIFIQACILHQSDTAFQITANEAINARKLADETAKLQLRAYVLYSDTAIELLPNGKNYLVSMSIKNRGQAPAYSVTYWWDSKILDTETGPRHVHNNKIEETGQISFDLDPTGEWPIEQPAKEISPSEFEDIRNGKKAIYVWGIIKYRDVFQRCQYANFLVKNGRGFASGKSRFDAIEVNNTIDEPCIKGENGALKSGFTNP